jgi:hypothetical protein
MYQRSRYQLGFSFIGVAAMESAVELIGADLEVERAFAWSSFDPGARWGSAPPRITKL